MTDEMQSSAATAKRTASGRHAEPPRPAERPRERSEEWKAIDAAIARLRASIMAVVFGLLGGTGLFVATMWLVIQGPVGGHPVGGTLSLLNHYFPGYEVTFGGAFLGFGYGALAGATIGWTVAMVYNLIAAKRHGQLTG
jgi:hypothetical protein